MKNELASFLNADPNIADLCIVMADVFRAETGC